MKTLEEINKVIEEEKKIELINKKYKEYLGTEWESWGEMIEDISKEAEQLGIKWGEEDKSVNGNYCTLSFGNYEFEIERISEEDESFDGAHEGIFYIKNIK